MLKLVFLPSDILHMQSKGIVEVTDEERKIFDGMAEVIKVKHGIGLAAVQVGILKAMIIVHVDEEASKAYYKNHDLVDIEDDYIDYSNDIICATNPIITKTLGEDRYMEEGCLSIPEQNHGIYRKEKIEVEYIDINNKKVTLKAKGLLARCFMHEIDHVNGILYVDHLKNMDKKMAYNKAIKIKQRLLNNES